MWIRVKSAFQYHQVPPILDPISSNGNSTVASISKLSPGNAKTVSLTQTSPVRTRRSHYHHRWQNNYFRYCIVNYVWIFMSNMFGVNSHPFVVLMYSLQKRSVYGLVIQAHSSKKSWLVASEHIWLEMMMICHAREPTRRVAGISNATRKESSRRAPSIDHIKSKLCWVVFDFVFRKRY